MSPHIILKSKWTRLKRKKTIAKSILVILLFILLFSGFVWETHNKYIRISKIEVEGNTVVLDKDIKNSVVSILKGEYIWIFPRNNIFIYPKQQIKKYILNTYSRIYSVNVKMLGMSTINIIIKERGPFALWCDNSFYDKNNKTDKCYFLDNSGYIFGKAPDISKNVYFEFYSNIKGNVVGTQFLPRNEFERVIKLKDSLNNADIKVDKFSISKNGDYIFQMGNPMKTILFFNKSKNLEKVFYNLKSAINVKTLDLKGENIFKDLKYIDLRFKNKVLFKY